MREGKPWTCYSLELNVPPEGDQVTFDGLLAGAGEVWLDDVPNLGCEE